MSVPNSNNNTIAHNDLSSNSWYGIELDGNGNKIANNTANDNVFEGFHFWFDADYNTLANNTAENNRNGAGLGTGIGTIVEGNNFSSNDRSGMVLYDSYDAIVRDNTVMNNVEHGIFVADSTNTTIDRNIVLGNLNRSIYISESDGVNITKNTITGGQHGIHLLLSTNISVEDNNVSWSQEYGIYLEVSNGTIIEHNNASHHERGIYTIFSNRTLIANNTVFDDENGIRTISSNNCTIVNNVVISNILSGIHLTRSNGSLVADNYASWNLMAGIIAFSSENNTIESNIVTRNNLTGIRMYGGSNTNKVQNNTVQHNMRGIWVGSNAYYNTIANNSASLNVDYGIHLLFGGGNIVADNSIFANIGTGIFVISSVNNRIYHNDIIENTFQGRDFTDANQWDDGYPSGGNYWSDYTGVDNCSGPNQDVCPDPDGIGDTPYIIDADSQDRYPFMFSLKPILTRPSTGVTAVLSGLDQENVTLNWVLSPDDESGFKSVRGYRVFRNASYDFNGSGYLPIATISNRTTEFVDHLAGEGDPSNYFYKVCAVNPNNETSCSEDQAAKFTRSLQMGANLVSIPLIQQDERVETVLQTLSYDSAWFYNSSAQEWESYARLKPFSKGFEFLNLSMGFWVDVTEDSNLTVAGVVPTQTDIQLRTGWNLVGFPSFVSTYTVADLGAVASVERVEAFNASSPPYFLRVSQSSDVLTAGHGFWIMVASDSIWPVSNT
jgi:parallel beta-helix repeat protein